MVSATIFIRKAFKELQTHSLFLNKWKLYNEQCHLCQRPHTAPELCFPETVMSHPQQETLQLLLDGDLWFTWIFDHRQHEVFSICRYFLINQDYIFPTFYRSLHSTYTRDDAYGCLELIYEMAEAEYDVLASRLLDYYNKRPQASFVPHSVLFRSTTLSYFLARARSTSDCLSKKRRFHASAIWYSP